MKRSCLSRGRDGNACPTFVLSVVCICRGRRSASPQADPASRLPASRATPRLIQTTFLLFRGTSRGRPLHPSSWQLCARMLPLLHPLSHLRCQLPQRGSQASFPPAPALERACLSPRERWQCRKALTERDRYLHPSTPSPLPPSPGKGDMMLKVRRTFGGHLQKIRNGGYNPRDVQGPSPTPFLPAELSIVHCQLSIIHQPFRLSLYCRSMVSSSARLPMRFTCARSVDAPRMPERYHATCLRISMTARPPRHSTSRRA